MTGVLVVDNVGDVVDFVGADDVVDIINFVEGAVDVVE